MAKEKYESGKDSDNDESEREYSPNIFWGTCADLLDDDAFLGPNHPDKENGK